MLGKVRQFPHALDPFIKGVDPQPDSTQPLSMSGQKQVLGCSRAVLHERSFPSWNAFHTYENGYRSLWEHRRIGMKLGDLVQDLVVIDDNEMPRLLVRS